MSQGEAVAMRSVGGRFLGALVFVVGAASLGLEIAAVRLIAPYFGASTIVWANVIAVVLIALSGGYWLGGWLGDRYPRLRELCLTVIAASILIAVVPFMARPFFDVSIGALDQIETGAFVGSLGAVLILIAVPVMLLGTVSPWAIRIAVADVAHSGRTAGRLYAISTLGSLAGTLSASLLLIPLVGTQRTFLAFAIPIAIVAAAGLGRRWIGAPMIMVGLLAAAGGISKPAADGTVIFETESEQQYIRVIEQADGDRALELNEGRATHSLIRPSSYLTGDVWDGYLVLPFTTLDRPPRRVAILGNAAGTIARAFGRYFPATRVDGVEIDPVLEEVGREYFDMGSNENLTVYNEDARPWLRRSEQRYDVIMVDAYRQPYIPFYLTTTEFFELVRDRLTDGGVVIINAGHPEGNNDLERVLGRTAAEVFATVLRDPIEPTNTLLIASGTPADASNLLDFSSELHADLRELAVASAARTEPRLPGGTVYTDDKAPVEWLIDRSIIGYAGAR